MAALLLLAGAQPLSASDAHLPEGADTFPVPLESYRDAGVEGLWAKLAGRAQADPFNPVATVIFLGAILHTFLTARFRRISHHLEHLDEKLMRHEAPEGAERQIQLIKSDNYRFWAVFFHFLGEVEAVFGIWLIPLFIAITMFKGLETAEGYINGVNYTEPIFVVVVMVIAGSRPVLHFAEGLLRRIAGVGGGTPAAWWFAILTFGPLLGSFITEPAAMTICALLLAAKFYSLNPSMRLRYATLGLLFVNVSIGGTLTHFAAPPVVMVATQWDWDTLFMLRHFGWKSFVSILLSNGLVFFAFRRELATLRTPAPETHHPARSIPLTIVAVHLLFIAGVVFISHYAAMVVLTFLFFLAYVTATERNQDVLGLRGPVLVGFFLAGLVIHGGCQKWWIEPVLSSPGTVELLLGSAALTAFNDNAAITYLASLVPGFSDSAKLAVVAGAVAGGGLTVIANAPNPAGQSILQNHFGTGGVDAFALLRGAALPTLVCIVVFLLMP
jgi:Na+/H+ antiporter NhaD/arsenite permease-like protein